MLGASLYPDLCLVDCIILVLWKASNLTLQDSSADYDQHARSNIPSDPSMSKSRAAE